MATPAPHSRGKRAGLCCPLFRFLHHPRVLKSRRLSRLDTVSTPSSHPPFTTDKCLTDDNKPPPITRRVYIHSDGPRLHHPDHQNGTIHLVIKNESTSNEASGWPLRFGLEMTLDTSDPEPGVYTLTTDYLDFMYGFAIMNDYGQVIYDIGSSSTDMGCVLSNLGNCRLESSLVGGSMSYSTLTPQASRRVLWQPRLDTRVSPILSGTANVSERTVCIECMNYAC